MHAYIDACTRLYDFLIDQYLFIGDTNYTGKGSIMYILITSSAINNFRSFVITDGTSTGTHQGTFDS